MPNNQETLTVDQLLEMDLDRAVLLHNASVKRFACQLPIESITDLETIHPRPSSLVVMGGGSLIDKAKLWRHYHAPKTRLIVIPSIWGSGAEASPIAVVNKNGTKEIHVDDDLLPDMRCVWPELARSIPPHLARFACGDTWSHALEGFLSPLADQDLQDEIAVIIQSMLELPIAIDPRWFEVSAQACAAQARSSVGLTHGIAHTLECRLQSAFPAEGWGHAKLCSVFLWPVMEFNRSQNDKWHRLSETFELDSSAIFETIRSLHDPDAYQQALPLLDEYWLEIARDPCSRTNSALVRPASKSFFLDMDFA